MEAGPLRRFANALALLFVALAAAALSYGAFMRSAMPFRLALGFLILAFACIQLRIRFGGRTHRTPLLYFHIAAALPFFFSVAALGFLPRSGWLLWCMAALGAVSAVSGTAVFIRPAPTTSDS